MLAPWIRCHFPTPDESLRCAEEVTDEEVIRAIKSVPAHYLRANGFLNDWLTLLFNNVAQGTMLAIGSGFAATGTAGSLYVSLHTADPGNAGSQNTNEAAYAPYARQAVARSSGGFTVSGQSVSLASAVSFPACTGGGETETHWGLGSALSAAGHLMYSGPVGSNQGEFATQIGATANTLFIPNISGVSTGQQMSFYALPGGTLPGGITQGVLYFVKSISGTQVTLSTTSGGATLTISSDGDGIAFVHTPIVVTASPSVTPQLTTATTIVER